METVNVVKKGHLPYTRQLLFSQTMTSKNMNPDNLTPAQHTALTS